MLDKSTEIIVATPHFGNGGVQRVTRNLIDFWSRQGYKVTIVQTHTIREKPDYPDPKGVEIIKVPTSTNKYMRYVNEIATIRRVLRSKPNSVAVSLSLAAVISLGIASIGLKNKLVVSERGSVVEHKGIRRLLKNYIFSKANVCVFQTQGAMDYFSPQIQAKGVVIPNPITDQLPLPYEGERRKVIVTATRLAPQKNLPMLFAAFSKILESYPDYTLEVYGRAKTQEEQERHEKIIRDMGMEDKIKLMGFAKNVHERMNDCSVFALPSDYEGMSNSMLEALAIGLPSVVTDHPPGGARAIIKSGINGILVPVDDAEAMYKGIKSILDDKNFAKMLSLNARKIKDELAIEKIGTEWLKHM